MNTDGKCKRCGAKVGRDHLVPWCDNCFLCTDCNGTGADLSKPGATCPRCKGKKFLTVDQEEFDWQEFI